MGVTKTVDDQRIADAIQAGLGIIGENYVQEGKRKIEKMGKTVEWHMIGHLQTNKAKDVVRLFDMIHSVDRLKLAQELDKRAGAAGIRMKILVEVNVSGEDSKSGVARDDAVALIREISALENISLQGLMTMPPWFDDPEDARPYTTEVRFSTSKSIRKGNDKANDASMGCRYSFAVLKKASNRDPLATGRSRWASCSPF